MKDWHRKTTTYFFWGRFLVNGCPMRASSIYIWVWWHVVSQRIGDLAKADLWHSASPLGFFHGYEGNSAISGTFYHLHTLNIVAKRGDLVDKQKEDNKKSKIQIIKKYDSRYQGPPLIYTHPWSLQRCKKMAPLICVTTKLVLMMTDTGPKIVRKYTEIKAITVK